MGEVTGAGRGFVGYDYKEIVADQEDVSMYLDGYENFGWIQDGNVQPMMITGKTSIKLKRDRRILNKAELTRLQRHFDACVHEIKAMEQSKHAAATMIAIGIGLVGTAFMAGSVFAVVAEPPKILLCILLAIPAFTGWLLPPLVYKRQMKKRIEKVTPLIEAKYDEIYEICEKGSRLI